MKIAGYLKTACCIVTLVVSAPSSCWAADSSANKEKAPPTVTWQSYLTKAEQHFHVTEKDLSNQKIQEQEKKNVKIKFPNATAEEVKKGIAEVNESLKLALKTVPPLAGLKDKNTAQKVEELAAAVGYILALDAVAIANDFENLKKAGTIKDQLVVLRRCDVLGQRDDRLAQINSQLIDKTFGTNGQKAEWKDKQAKPERCATLHILYKEGAAKMHDASAKLQKQIAILEKKDPNTKVTK